jgi:hypothetical protein
VPYAFVLFSLYAYVLPFFMYVCGLVLSGISARLLLHVHLFLPATDGYVHQGAVFLEHQIVDAFWDTKRSLGHNTKQIFVNSRFEE